MKNLLIRSGFLALCLSIFVIFAAAATTPPVKIDIYPTNWDGTPIPNKVFTISPALANGATSVTGNATFARIFVSSACPTAPGSAPCFKKNVTYTVSGGACLSRLRIKFLNAYTWTSEPSVLFKEFYDGNEGFHVSGGSNFVYSILPRTSPLPCG